MTELYKNIKKLREELGLSQEELAKRTGYTNRSSIAKIEKGLVDLSQTKIELFAKVLGVAPGDLMGWEQEPPQEEPTFNEQSLIKKYRLLSNREQAAVDNLINNLSQTEKTPAKIDYSRFKTAEEIMKEDHLIAKGGGKVNISKENLQKIIEKAKKDE